MKPDSFLDRLKDDYVSENTVAGAVYHEWMDAEKAAQAKALSTDQKDTYRRYSHYLSADDATSVITAKSKAAAESSDSASDSSSDTVKKMNFDRFVKNRYAPFSSKRMAQYDNQVIEAVMPSSVQLKSRVESLMGKSRKTRNRDASDKATAHSSRSVIPDLDKRHSYGKR